MPRKHALMLAVTIKMACLLATAIFLFVLRDRFEIPNLLDRINNTGSVAIHPDFITLDRPQSLFVSSRGLSAPTLNGKPIPFIQKGRDFYQLIFDPADHPSVAAEKTITIDFKNGKKTPQSLSLVTLYTPSLPSSLAVNQSDAIICDETRDELIHIDAKGQIQRHPTLDGPFQACFTNSKSTKANADDQTVMIAHRYSHDLLQLNLKSNARKKFTLPGIPTAITALELNQKRYWLVSTTETSLGGLDHFLYLVDGGNGKIRSQIDLRGEVDHLVVIPRNKNEASEIDLHEIGIIAASRNQRELYYLSFFPLPFDTEENEQDTDQEAGQFVLVDDKALARPAIDLKVTPDGQAIWICCTGYEPDGMDLTANHHIEDGILILDSQTLETIEWRPTKKNRQIDGNQKTSGISPMSITFHGRQAHVVFAGSHERIVMPWPTPRSPETPGTPGNPENLKDTEDKESDEAPEGSVAKAPPWHTGDSEFIDLKKWQLMAPTHIAASVSGHTYILSRASGEIALFDLEGKLKRQINLMQNPEALKQSFPDTWQSIMQRRAGVTHFYDGTREGISCQSCHTHGDSDYARHNIGADILIGTLSTEGIAGTSPYLRDASYNRLRDVHDIHEDLFGGFSHGPSIRERAVAIEHWLANRPLPFHPNLITMSDTSTEAKVAQKNAFNRGWLAFEKAGCASCHALPLTSNLADWPSQWLFPEDQTTALILDTPTLFGLWRSAPYLHDGRAFDLHAVLAETNPLARHGQGHLLNQQEHEDLIAWLKSF